MEDINVFEFLSYIKKHAIFFVLVMFFVLIICLFYCGAKTRLYF